MTDPLTGGLLLGGGLAAARAAWLTWIHGAADDVKSSGVRAHRRACEAVVQRFLNSHGFLTRQVATRAELEGWISDGIAPRQLERLLASRARTVQGILLGHQAGRDAETAVRLPLEQRARHIYAVGKTGSGKTTMMGNFSLQAIEMGEGLAVVAPEAEFIYDELLPHVPKHRWHDVVVFDPTRDSPSLNPLHLAPGEDLDLRASELMSIFQRLCDEGTGGAPRMETILRQALYALLPLPDTTLLDVERLLDRHDDTYRRFVIEHSADEDTRNFWSRVYPSYPRDAHLSLHNRLSRFLRPRTVRTLLCSSSESFDVRGAMDDGKVLFFSLSDGLLGEENAELLGQLVVAKIQLAAMSRADVPAHERRAFTLVCDEFQRFSQRAGSSYEQMLSRARKYGLGLVLAHQQTGQIPEQLMRGILGNVGTVIAFQMGASDARRLSRELVGEVDGEPVEVQTRELLGLRVGEAICRVGRNVFRLRTLPPPRGGSARTQQTILDLSRRQFAARPSAARITAPPTGTDDLDPGAVF